MSGISELPDETLLDLEELCGKMLKLSRHLLQNSAIGMYKQFLYNSVVGADCDYAKRSRLMFWKQQKDGVKTQLIELRDGIDKAIQEIEDRTWDPTTEI
tara:strand:+ start:1327 stop:1623 length:297 start_codon:yes stop_codon:yes gene_type:complete